MPTIKLASENEDIAIFRAKMKALQQQIGGSVSDLNLLITVTGRAHRLIIESLNKSDFSRIEGLAWEN